MSTIGWSPQGSYGSSCGHTLNPDSCFIPFTFGVPFRLEVRAAAESSYYFYRNSLLQDSTVAGNMIISSAFMHTRGVYRLDHTGWTELSGALMKIAVNDDGFGGGQISKIPEPSTTGIVAGGCGILLLLCRRRRA
jgi:hypothetical protein